MRNDITNCILKKNGALNLGTFCNEAECRKCGWNPAVAAERKKQKLVKGPNDLMSLKKVEE